MKGKVGGGGEGEEGGGRQKGERLVEKLRRRALLWVGHTRSGGIGRPSTPAHVSFLPHPSRHRHTSPPVSSRQLAAALWEFHRYYDRRLPPPKMRRGAHGTAATNSRRHRQGKAVLRDAGLDVSRFLPDASPDHQPESAGSLRRHIAQTLMKHHQLVERSNQALQPVSPATFDSSLEVAPYNQVVTPSSSLEFRGRQAGEPHYNLKKTSAELLKVLNRIWSLEEQHSANVSVIKSLKAELSHARVRIKELLRDQKADRRELDDLMKQLAEDKLLRRTAEHDRISSAVQTVREELEDERKLRKRSEGLHRKLARELSEAKSTLSSCVKELERETKSRKMMERLCDEFARGIKGYEREIHTLNQKLGDRWEGRDERDRMVLHVAESWLDERMQMRLKGANSTHGVEKLEFEIETFLRDKQKTTGSTENPNPLQKDRRSSLESVPLNSAVPRDVGDEEESTGSDSNCFELKKPGNEDEPEKRNQENREDESVEKPKGKSKSPSSLQVKFEEQMEWAMSCNGKKKSRAVEIEEEEEGFEPERNGNSNKAAESEKPNSNSVIEDMIRTHRRLLSGSHENDEASCSYPSQRQASPVRQWTSRTVTPDLVDLSVSKAAQAAASKDNNTLKAKLAEVRSKSSRPRLRLFKG